jgi:hypothetical protein
MDLSGHGQGQNTTLVPAKGARQLVPLQDVVCAEPRAPRDLSKLGVNINNACSHSDFTALDGSTCNTAWTPPATPRMR